MLSLREIRIVEKLLVHGDAVHRRTWLRPGTKKKVLSRLGPTSVTTKFLPYRLRRAVASPIHSPSTSPISISLGARCLSAVRAWVMRDFTPTSYLVRDHYGKWASTECHPATGLCEDAIIKCDTTARMPSEGIWSLLFSFYPLPSLFCFHGPATARMKSRQHRC